MIGLQSRIIMTVPMIFVWLAAFSLLPSSHAFGLSAKGSRSLATRTFGVNDSVNNEEEPEDTVVGQPKSQMMNYAAIFLDKAAQDSNETDKAKEASQIAAATLEDISEATHLVAIPLESSHELLIELESVQRAILHHCPILLDACISGTLTRLPLLYIQAPDANVNENPQNSASVTTSLARTLRRLVKKHIYEEQGTNGSSENKEEPSEEWNAQGYRPLTMTFKNLEIDGANNNILNTVGTFCHVDEDLVEETDTEALNYNEQRFNNLIQDLRSAVAAQGWKMAFPPDPNRSEYVTDETNESLIFRPRVPFMELPKGFNDNIDRFKSGQVEITEENFKYLNAGEGGNGISPIFWANWWEDVFARNVRLQEIGIYPTNHVLEDTEDDASLKVQNEQFYLPFESIALPDGTDKMIEVEQKFLDYHEKRIQEKEEEFRKEVSEPQASPVESQNPLSQGSSSNEPDIMMKKTRKRLENIYLQNAGIEDSDALLEQLEQESIDEEEEIVNSKDSTRSTENDYMEDWMRERILQAKESNQSSLEDDTNKMEKKSQPSKEKTESSSRTIDPQMEEKVKKAVNSLESVKSRQMAKKEPKVSIEDNPVFKAYREGTLNTETPKTSSIRNDLGPYPGNDHFVGIWKVTVNPMGGEDNTSSEDGSENLILRVDGTTAAGPTLNPDTKQKAAGGTWKMIPQENGDVLLRIRLVIPPEKKRILVMEGRVVRGSELEIQMASKTFGIPQLERKAKEANRNQDDMLTCSGESYIEDAITKKNRIRAENFYIEKVAGRKDPDNYTITIPKTLRRLD